MYKQINLLKVLGLFLILILPYNGFSQKQIVGQAYYDLSLPSGHKGPSDLNGVAAVPKITPDFTKPIQTNDWWTSFMWRASVFQYTNWDNHSWPSYAHPLAFQACRYGLKMKYPTHCNVFEYNTDPKGAYRYAMDAEDITVTLDGMDLTNDSQTKVKDYSDWSFTAYWSDEYGNSLTATMGHGFLYTYFTKTGADVILRFRGTPTIIHNNENALCVSINDHYYGLFAPSGASWNTSLTYPFDENVSPTGSESLINRVAYSSNLNGEDYFSIAILPDNSIETFEKFNRHAFVFIDSTQVSWDFNENEAELLTDYNFFTTVKEGVETETMYAMYQHQWRNYPEVSTPYTYVSPRGQMKVNEGNEFSIKLENFGFIPYLPWAGNYDSLALISYLEDERKVTNVYNTNNDSYFNSIRICRQAQLAEVANNAGNIVAREKFLDDVQFKLEDWFKADDGETTTGHFYYDEKWNSLIAYPAGFYADRNLNDHHFHYGYMIRAAAILAQFRPGWAKDEAFGGMVKLLIKDVANWDREDKRFPMLRYYDAYAGHSWAGGSSGGWGGYYGWGADQEASGEAMNFATAVFLWGLNTNNTELRDLGLFLALNEKQAIDYYWHDKDGDVFPGNFGHVSGTRIWSSGVDKIAYNDEWSVRPEYIMGINIAPAYASALYLADPEYIKANYDEMVARHGGEPTMWNDLIWFYLSMYDPALALSEYRNSVQDPPYRTNLPYIPITDQYAAMYDDPISPSFLYHWLITIRTLGKIDNTITANTSSYAVFKRDGGTHYVVYNPGEAKEVEFSDGTTYNVPSDTLIALNFSVALNVDDVSVEDKNKLTVYPNPGKGEFVTSSFLSDMSISLYNPLGQQLWSKQVSKNEKLKFKLYIPGVYMLTAENSKVRYSTKLIVVK